MFALFYIFCAACVCCFCNWLRVAELEDFGFNTTLALQKTHFHMLSVAPCVFPKFTQKGFKLVVVFFKLFAFYMN